MNSAAAAERHPVLNERRVSRTAEGCVSRALIHTKVTLRGVVPAVGVTCNNVGLNNQLAVFVVPHMLLVNAYLNICIAHSLAVDVSVYGKCAVNRRTGNAVLLCNIQRIYAEIQLSAGLESGRSKAV